MNTETKTYSDGTTATGLAPLPEQSPRQQDVRHDYPACAIFRGGKCTCDEADKLCPKCGSEEWDEVYEPGRVTPSYRRCAYSKCDHEWEPRA